MSTLEQKNIFEKIGLAKNPIFLAPLAGVSDSPFRRICYRGGADLCYVEMISAPALIRDSKRTLQMLYRHPEEQKLGVQITSSHGEEMAQAISILNNYDFNTIDLNMGCPVKKVVNHGRGSAALKDPKKVYELTKAATDHANVPVSVKIRLGWDHNSLNYLDVAQAAQDAGAQWLTVHGRTRSDDYSCNVNLEAIAQIKQKLQIPVIGNGNIFSKQDYSLMKAASSVDGVMVSRGALGNPWIFKEIKENFQTPSIEEWLKWLLDHISWHEAHYQNRQGVITMRKHLLWYLKGWESAKSYRQQLQNLEDFDLVRQILSKFSQDLKELKQDFRLPLQNKKDADTRFYWNPVFDMDRQLDKAVGEDLL